MNLSNLMFYYISEYLKWLQKKPEPKLEPKPQSQEIILSELIRKRAEEQNAVIDRKKEEEVPAKVAEKDFFE